jgi:3-deoxy-7-phosphoheptulonate synthase
MGAEKVADALPPLVQKVTDHGAQVVWVCDPMHGNTVELTGRRKTRFFGDIASEVATFFDVHRSLGTHPGGIHLEFTGDHVTECVGGRTRVAPGDLGLHYETTCDPRLNRSQALDLAFMIADIWR